MTAPWQHEALRDLAAAWPDVEWGVGECDGILGWIGDVRVHVERLPRDLGWLRAQVSRNSAPLGTEVEGMDPRDAARAVRSALRRLAAKAPGGRVVLRGGACG